jgi:hypothetical protein
MAERFPVIKAKYSGPLHLVKKELTVPYGQDKIIFIDDCNDLWAEPVPFAWIMQVLYHCDQWPDNDYVFQTKNPGRYRQFVGLLPKRCVLGCTIETNRYIINDISRAPEPAERMLAMEKLQCRKFLTIEPIMDFDVDIMMFWIKRIMPDFVNLGADSKRNRLPEPTANKIMELISALNTAGIELREKHNLQRLKQKG